jgi:polyhydroxyalkanoate synthesis regulator phasin
MFAKGMYSNVIDEINSYIERIDHILDELVRKGQMNDKIGIEYAFVNYVLCDAIVWVIM